MRFATLSFAILLCASLSLHGAEKKGKQQPRGAAAAERAFNAVDRDESGTLTPLEFIGPTYNSFTAKRKLQFLQWDGNRDGQLSLDEVKKGYARELAKQEARRKQQKKRRNRNRRNRKKK